MRPPVLLRQTVKSVTADRKTRRINSKSAPPIPKNAIGTCRQAMSADNVLHPCRQVLRPCRGKNKYSCLVKRIYANGLKHQTLPLMGATRLASGLKQGLTDRCDLVLSVSLYLVYGQGIFPTRDASPPLVVAFGVQVRRMFTFHQTAIKTKVVQTVVNAIYTTFYFGYQRYYTQKCRVQTKCGKSLYGECTSGFQVSACTLISAP